MNPGAGQLPGKTGINLSTQNYMIIGSAPEWKD